MRSWAVCLAVCVEKEGAAMMAAKGMVDGERWTVNGGVKHK